MMEGYRSGIITEERLQEALERILGTKAALGLHTKARDEILQPKDAAMARIGLPENKAIAAEVADKAITLVKSKDPGVLPISPEKFKRVLLVPIKGPSNPMAHAMHGGAPHPATALGELLARRGYDVTFYESLADRLAKMSPDEGAKLVMSAYAGKAPVSAMTDNYDMVISVAKVEGLMQPVERIYWPASKGTPDIPWYVHELPVIFVSTASPNLLADVPQVKTYINTYDDRPYTLEALVEKLEGHSEFTGAPSTDVFCGLADTHI
jgi:beta-N-acetylhexosaminidase